MRHFYFFIGLTLFVTFISLSPWVYAVEPDFSIHAKNILDGRANIYELPIDEWRDAVREGRRHAIWYPVTATEPLIPEAPFMRALGEFDSNPFMRLARRLLLSAAPVRTFDESLAWMGLNEFPREDLSLARERVYYRYGYTPMVRGGARGFTFSCMMCHSSALLGRTVFGLTNRFARANEVFVLGKKVLGAVHPLIFQQLTGADRAETQMYARTRNAIHAVEVKMPMTLGLDTSLSQTALSLARRNPDDWATRSDHFEKHPRADWLDQVPADSKPAVWWNVKYKTRWLSDGSIISGNPIYTNFLWNEIGRGVNLESLYQWTRDNPRTIRDLTAAVFATQAPKYADFFPYTYIRLERAKRGAVLFREHCAGCHGQYAKGFDLPDAAATLSVEKQLETIHVAYPEKTKRVDVGTDSLRARGMVSLETSLNPLAFSKALNTVIRAQGQSGYVPPPLVGIWSRFPYFHNNSAPNLCAVLTRSDRRPEKYQAISMARRDAPYDHECVGYPRATEVRDDALTFTTRRPGQQNIGHDEGIFLENGRELLSDADKWAVVEFLKTL